MDPLLEALTVPPPSRRCPTGQAMMETGFNDDLHCPQGVSVRLIHSTSRCEHDAVDPLLEALTVPPASRRCLTCQAMMETGFDDDLQCPQGVSARLIDSTSRCEHDAVVPLLEALTVP